MLVSYGAKMIVHAEDSTAIERAPAANGRRYADFLVPSARGGERRDRAPHRSGPAHPGVRALAAPFQLGCRADGAHRSARGHRDDRRDLPALPGVRGTGHRRRRDAVQVLPSDPRGGQPRGAVARAGPWRHRLHRLRPLAVHRRAQAARAGRFRSGLGRDLVAAAGAVRGMDGGSPARLRAGRRRPVDGGTAGVHCAAAAEGPDRTRLPRRLRGVRARRRVRRGPGTPAPPQPITPYAFRPLAGVVRSTWLRGRRVTGEERHGRLDQPRRGRAPATRTCS